MGVQLTASSNKSYNFYPMLYCMHVIAINKFKLCCNHKLTIYVGQHNNTVFDNM